MDMRNYDAIVVGSGPNGLAAAITLQREGLSVLVVESTEQPGGGMRTADLTLPGFRHDVCSTILPLAVASPFLSKLPLQQFGLQYVFPSYEAAHPFDDGSTAILMRSLDDTAERLGGDCKSYKQVMNRMVNDWQILAPELLAPLHFPKHPITLARFGARALTSAIRLSKRFKTTHAKGLWAGMAAHSIQPLSNLATSAAAMVLMCSGHVDGWPLARGGSASLANALVSYFISLGGKIKTGFNVTRLSQLPSSRATLFDITPRQLLQIEGLKFSRFYTSQLRRYRYGAGIFKIDWALSDPIPFKSNDARKAGTVHLGNTLEEIAQYEKDIWKGKIGDRPFVLLAQPTIFDPSRAPKGKHTAWAYCHVPHGSLEDMTEKIEMQVERFAPGFRQTILAQHTFNTAQLEEYNSNYVGGDINGGVFDIGQLFTRPALRTSPYRTSQKGIYICSSSTPPGGGVHGMCGYHSACTVLKDIFGIEPKQL